MSSKTLTVLDNWTASSSRESDEIKEYPSETIKLEIGVMKVFQQRPAKTDELPVSISSPQYRVSSLLFSSFSITFGLFDFLGFFFTGKYFFHPSFDLLLFVGGLFLLFTTLLAIKGK